MSERGGGAPHRTNPDEPADDCFGIFALDSGQCITHGLPDVHRLTLTLRASSGGAYAAMDRSVVAALVTQLHEDYTDVAAIASNVGAVADG